MATAAIIEDTSFDRFISYGLSQKIHKILLNFFSIGKKLYITLQTNVLSNYIRGSLVDTQWLSLNRIMDLYASIAFISKIRIAAARIRIGDQRSCM